LEFDFGEALTCALFSGVFSLFFLLFILRLLNIQQSSILQNGGTGAASLAYAYGTVHITIEYVVVSSMIPSLTGALVLHSSNPGCL
jgi:hypothetical protein